LLQDLHSGAWYLFIASSRAFGFWLDVVCLIYITVVTISFFLIGGKLLDIRLDLLLSDKKNIIIESWSSRIHFPTIFFLSKKFCGISLFTHVCCVSYLFLPSWLKHSEVIKNNFEVLHCLGYVFSLHVYFNGRWKKEGRKERKKEWMNEWMNEWLIDWLKEMWEGGKMFSVFPFCDKLSERERETRVHVCILASLSLSLHKGEQHTFPVKIGRKSDSCVMFMFKNKTLNTANWVVAAFTTVNFIISIHFMHCYWLCFPDILTLLHFHMIHQLS